MSNPVNKTSMTLCRLNTARELLVEKCPRGVDVWMLAKDFGEGADTITDTETPPFRLKANHTVTEPWEIPIEKRIGEPDTNTSCEPVVRSQRIEVEFDSEPFPEGDRTND